MKIDPINLILDTSFKFKYKYYFVSGNEITLMEKMKELIVENCTIDNILQKETIKEIGFYGNDVGLFNNKKLYVVKDIKNINEEKISQLNNNEDIFIFFVENSPKIKKIKSIFSKKADSVLLDCYELTKEQKVKIFNKHIKDHKIELDTDAYWLVVEKLNNKFSFLEKELEKLNAFENKKLDTEIIDKVISKNTYGLDKIFFEILNSNEKIINTYNDKVTNEKEVNEFYYSLKQFCNLIINNYNEDSFSKNIPVYLFREKNHLLSVFKKFNNKKRIALISLMLKTEKSIRLNGNLSTLIGLRFLLNFKRLVIS